MDTCALYMQRVPKNVYALKKTVLKLIYKSLIYRSQLLSDIPATNDWNLKLKAQSHLYILPKLKQYIEYIF